MIVNELKHHGVLGMKWGVRRTQAQLARAEKRDTKWAQTKGEKIKAKTQNAVKKDMNQFVRNELNANFKTNGKLTSESILRYNNKLAELMNQKVGDIPSPSGKVLRFVSKRGELGVHTALADSGYDMSQLDRGVFGSGKVAYKKDNLMHTEIFHHGVLGMKWGVRKDTHSSLTTKSGDKISVIEHPTSKVAQVLGKTFPGIRKEAEKTINADIYDPNGKKVGDTTLYMESPDSMNVVWIGIDDANASGKGYAQAVMQASIQLAKDKGLKQVTLEVPGNSPNARHIYEKLGFKETGVVSTPEDDPVWAGLTAMALDFSNLKHASSESFTEGDIKKWMLYVKQNLDNLMKGG